MIKYINISNKKKYEGILVVLTCSNFAVLVEIYI